MDLIVWAIPGFLVLLLLEALAYRLLPDEGDPGERRQGYAARDTATNIGMGLGNLAVNAGWKAVVLAVYAGLYAVTPLRLDPGDWRTWALLFLLDDLCYYAFHRVHHEVRLFWASHVVHHSSGRYNLSTAVRQTWTPMTGLPFWLMLPLLGFAPWMVLTMQSVSLIYQFWVHTERVRRLGPLEWVLNTPSHHRVHHGSNKGYLDTNYGGTLIVWDRLFGTFTPEREPVVYGLTTPLTTANPLRVAFHEWAAIGRDLHRSRSWRQRAGYLLRRPGWSPRTT